MIHAFRTHWKTYMIEAWALGTFMVSACLFTILLQHPGSPVRHMVPSDEVRRGLMGLAMGLTLVLIVYSKWGKKSGALMNPAATLAQFQMDRISFPNAVWYILFQFAGGLSGVFLVKGLFPSWIMAPDVHYAVTTPGMYSVLTGFLAEFFISFVMLTTVLLISNSAKAKYTGWAAGFLVMLFIALESPVSGMSMNPARTLASALPAQHWNAWWIYFTAPVAGMLTSGMVYRRWYRWRHGGNCLTMKCHFSGHAHDCRTYEVLGPVELLAGKPEPVRKFSMKDRAMLPR